MILIELNPLIQNCYLPNARRKYYETKAILIKIWCPETSSQFSLQLPKCMRNQMSNRRKLQLLWYKGCSRGSPHNRKQPRYTVGWKASPGHSFRQIKMHTRKSELGCPPACGGRRVWTNVPHRMLHAWTEANLNKWIIKSTSATRKLSMQHKVSSQNISTSTKLSWCEA